MSLKFIESEKIIAVLRGVSRENIDGIVKSLNRGGINLLEITLDNPDALEMIKHVKETYGESVMVGAGTVLDAESARVAIMAGAQFIFSPTVNLEMIRMTKRYGAISMPGAFTPTEILTAYEHGADAVKVFPVSALKESYLNDIFGPLPHIPVVPTGGIDQDNISEYLQKNNVIAVGVGSSLVNAKYLKEPQALAELEKKAEVYRHLAGK